MVFEARIEEGDVFKKLISSIVDLVQDANFECTDKGIQLQAMDSSHVSLVSMYLFKESFEHYNCTKTIQLGINTGSLAKVLKCSKAKDSITLRYDDDNNSDTLTLIFSDDEQNRTLNFSLKLMDIDSESLLIPDTEYKCTIMLSSKEFKELCQDCGSIGDSISIACNKNFIKFGIIGDIGSGDICYKNIKNGSKLMNNNNNTDSKDNNNDDGMDLDEIDWDKLKNNALIRADETVSLNFAIRYLIMFSKASSLSKNVILYLSDEVPLVVEYKIDGIGHIKYYLAPKIEDEE